MNLMIMLLIDVHDDDAMCLQVVSGVPQENGLQHLSNLCDVSLDIMKVCTKSDVNRLRLLATLQFLEDFCIPHRKEQRIKIRIGLHTGPVAAGVVGM